MSAEVSGFVVPAVANPWGTPLGVAIYRRRVRHRTAKNFQLDLFDPDDGYYEHSAITSNLDYTLANLWHFMAGRGAHEKTIAQLKSGLAFHTVPTLAYAANSAWRQLVALTHNLLTNFQIDTGAEQRRRSRKHTALPRLSTVQTLRFTRFHRAALLMRPAGKSILRLAKNPATEDLFTRIERELPCGLSFCRIRVNSPSTRSRRSVSSRAAITREEALRAAIWPRCTADRPFSAPWG